MPQTKVLARGKVGILRFDMNSQNLRITRDLPDQLGFQGRDLRFEMTAGALLYIQEQFPGALWDETSKNVLSIIGKVCVARSTPDHVFSFKTEPFKHQLEVFEISKDIRGFALLMEQGTGKSKVIADNSAYLYAKKRILGLLVFAPNGVHRNWETDELPTHMPDWTNYSCVSWTASKGEKRLRRMIDDKSPGLKVFCMNIEALSTKRGEEAAKRFMLEYPSMIVIDEATMIKTPKAKRTKSAQRLGLYALYRRILTGTIVTKGPLDVYEPFQFLEDGILGHHSYYSFKARYTIQKELENKLDSRGKAIKVVVAYQNLEELRDVIKPHSYRKLKSECFDLPSKLYQRRPFQMSGEQWDIYCEMQENMEVQYKGRVISAPMAMVRQMRLAQIACGYLPTENPEEDPGELIGKSNPRLEALMEDIGPLMQADKKIIIASPWKASLRDIYKAIADNYGSHTVIAYGGQKSKQTDDQKAAAKKAFQTDDQVRVWVGQSDTTARGHTLTQAAWMFIYAQRYNLEVRLQIEDRAHRWGQTSNVLYTDYEAQYDDNFTTDRDVIDNLKKKKVIADLINGDNPPTQEWMAEQMEAVDKGFYAKYGFKG